VKRLSFVFLLVFGFSLPVNADPVLIKDGAGKQLSVEVSWSEPVDLDLFLTDPDGETVYFANRMARSGVAMGDMMGCKNIEAGPPPYTETIIIPSAAIGGYRVSVDYIKDCGSNSLQAEFEIRLVDPKTRMQLGQGQSSVKYRLLDTVSWEFEVK